MLRLIESLDYIYEALKSNHLSQVALDVTPQEPPGDHDLITAWRTREKWLGGRLLINPHTSYYSSASYIEMRSKAAENAFRIIKGETPLNPLW